MSEKRKWDGQEASVIAAELIGAFRDYCQPDRIMICGSIRRCRPLVGDIEIVYVSKIFAGRATDFFAAGSNESAADLMLDLMLSTGTLAKRLNVNGSPAWGDSNKLAVHVASGIPVDFFAATEDTWWNNVVCRTGGRESNTIIATRAKSMGWKWNSTGVGFVRVSGPDRGRVVPVRSERDVFDFVKLGYLEPEKRP